MNEIKNNGYYEQGLKEEEKKSYLKAIELYLLASLEEGANLRDIYAHLAYVLHKKKSYEASCNAFCLGEKKVFFPTTRSIVEEQENRELIYEDINREKQFTHEDWLEIAEKAERLKFWNIAAYAYKEHLARNANFDASLYQKMGYAYLQDQSYKEASFAFQEEKMRSMLESFPLEERIIVYEGDGSAESLERLYTMYEALNNDAHFDAYQHVWVGKSLSLNFKNLNQHSTIFIDRSSDLYFMYLAKSKYIIATQNLHIDFKRKPQQVFLALGEDISSTQTPHCMSNDVSLDEVIQEIFFQNKKIAFELKHNDEELIKLYESAIDDFTNELWESSYTKFIKVKAKSKDIVFELPTLYYIKESQARNTVKNDNKRMEDLLYYRQYRFTAENFVGIAYLLKKASKNSVDNPIKWKAIEVSFLEILEDIKRNKTKNIRSISDKIFLNKVEKFSKLFDASLEAKLLPYKIWFVFANLFIFARLYVKYQLVREKALNSIVEVDATDDINLLRYKLNAFTEKKDIENYRLLRDKLMLNSKEYIKDELSLVGSLDCYFNEEINGQSFYTSGYTKDERAFSKYIENKTIAIVGPVHSDLKVGEEIDAHDVVVRFNYKGLDASLKENLGSKTDVSFYISEILVPNKLDTSKVAKMNELEWVIFDKAHKKNSPCFIGLTQNIRAGYFTADAFSNPYLKGTPSGIQRVILDLLRFKVGKIKVYNSNLFLENKYDANYKSRGALGADHFNFIWHDPLSNFVFLKRLKENSIIEVDPLLNEILELTPQAYIEALEERYGREIDDVK